MPAVLIGEFVSPRSAPPPALPAVEQALARAARQIEPWLGHPLRCFVLEDGRWHALIEREGKALRCALRLLGHLRLADAPPTRLAIGLGPAAGPTPKDPDLASGLAYSRASETLYNMPRSRRLSLSERGVAGMDPAAVTLLDALMRTWTRAQTEALLPMISDTPPTQAALARQLGITQQSVADRLAAVPFWALNALLDAWETSVPTPIPA